MSWINLTNTVPYSWNNLYSLENNWWIHFTEDFTLEQSGQIIPKGFLLNTRSRVTSVADYNSGWNMQDNYRGSNYQTGGITSTEEGYLVLNEGDSSAAENRLAVVFPLEDTGISGAVKETGTTQFWGKFSIVPQEGSTSTSGAGGDAILKAEFYECDLVPDDLFQQHLDSLGIGSLIETQLSEIISNNETLDFTSYSNYPSQAFSENWNEPNNFNAAAIRFWVQGGSSAVKVRLNHLGVKHIVDVEDIFSKKFFINSKGRGIGEISLSSPPEIIRDIIRTEMDLTNLDYDFYAGYTGEFNDYNQANWEMAFSVDKQKNSKDLIEEIAKSSNFIPYFKFTATTTSTQLTSTVSSASLSFSVIQEEYINPDHRLIKSSEVINFSFERTPIEDVKTNVRVKYKKDYATGDFTEVTPYKDVYDFFGNGDRNFNFHTWGEYQSEINANGYSKAFMGLKPNDAGDSVLEVESEYIRKLSVANRLRNFLLAFNCNQHNIIRLRLPLKFIDLEIGDIIRVDSLINGLLCYGEDYTNETQRNGQTIYPYFMITSVSKSLKIISLDAIQLHKLTPTEGIIETGNGDLARIGNPDFNYNSEDASVFEDYLLGLNQYITEGQLQNLDMNHDGIVDFTDYALWSELFLNVAPWEEEEVVDDDVPETYIENTNYVGTIQLQHQLSGTEIEVGLDDDEPSPPYFYGGFGILHGDEPPTTDRELLYLEWGYIQISTLSSIFTTGGTFINTYPDYDMEELQGWYCKIGHEWVKIHNVTTFEDDGSTYTYFTCRRNQFTDINDLENYDSTALPPYSHSIGEDVRVYSGHPVFINETIDEEETGG